VACPAAAAGAVVDANAVCGAAASAPTTATAGAALPAARATFWVCEGAVCRPVLRNFLFLLRDFLAFKSLPYADPRPATRQLTPLTRPDIAHRAAWQDKSLNVYQSGQKVDMS
jgi:hypothetical protein